MITEGTVQFSKLEYFKKYRNSVFKAEYAEMRNCYFKSVYFEVLRTENNCHSI